MNKNENVLNIKGAVLDKNQLENYLQKIATDHTLQDYSFKETYPIPRLEDNFYVITETYNLLNQHINLGINIHPAGEWILDNYYIIEETVKIIKKELSVKKYVNFLGISNGMYNGYARIYILAAEIVAYTDNKIDAKTLETLLKSYQSKKNLSMEELWNISIFLQISIIENIRQICKKIYLSQLQKYKVESIIERLIENKPKEKQKYKANYKQKIKKLGLDELKYPFIEYMSYKLKTYGKQTYPFLQALEEQVEKKGLTVSEVIKKEHFDMAVRKVSMGNCIKSLKDILRINFQEIFERINGVEEILKQDPANVYDKMDYKTKIEYTNKIKQISKKTKISEIYIAKLAINLSQTAKQENVKNEKKTHVGYYLISNGIQELISKLQNRNLKKISNKTKEIIYISLIFLIPLIISVLLIAPLQISNILKIIGFILIYIPIEEIVKNIIQYVLIKTVSLKKIPKIDIQGNIPEELATFVVIPTIVKDKKKVEDLMKRLEAFYIANKSKNIYFALLGDAALSQKKDEKYDNEVIQAGLDCVEILNSKYKNEDFPIFHFIYRKRTWSKGENAYLGWERKRGLLTEFNEYILGHTKNNFKKNTLQNFKIPKIKYVITLDADTDLSLNSGFDLIGAMAHILNKPILNSKEDLVIDGTALIQPRVGINLKIAFKNLFTKIYAGSGGTDVYSAAISDVYQDTFNEGIFTGKGIYDLEVFSKILTKEIPENTVLSHDLLEGSYLRCYLATDIVLLDGYPSGYLSYSKRNHRWIRGDWQISKWIFKNKLNILSKYKILDNMIRSLNEFSIVLSLIYFIILNISLDIKTWYFITILLVSSAIPTIIDILNNIIFKKQNIEKQRNFSDAIGGLKSSIIRGILSISLLPDKAYSAVDAVIRTIYRMTISKKHLLEWTTAEEAEKQAKDDLISYYKTMLANIVAAMLILLLGIIKLKINNIYIYVLATLWLIAPYIMWYISKTKTRKQIKQTKLKEPEKDYIKMVAKDTWEYFKQNITKENNYLPPDNYQEDRSPQIVNRTSSTNIGLGLLSVVSAYDMGYIKKEETIDLIEKMLNTIISLPKWNGHLYNWYNIKTLEPLVPRYISTVDSGNLIGYLYVLKQFIIEQKEETKTEILLNNINDLINKTDFSYLYNEEIRLLSIGFNVEENKLTDSYYDLLASEARQASLIAIAKKDIPAKNWTSLSRTLTVLNKYKGLISWSGTAFEYLMPNINIEKYEGSLLSESSKFMIMAQKEYAKKLGIPWGISESAFNIKDLNGNYQYKAFGIPWLGLKRGLSDEIVVSSYRKYISNNRGTKTSNCKLKNNRKRRGIWEIWVLRSYRLYTFKIIIWQKIRGCKNIYGASPRVNTFIYK